MAGPLILRLQSAVSAPLRVDWLQLSPAGQVLEAASDEPLDALPEGLTGSQVWAIAPAEDCLLSTAQLPVRQRARMLKALPFAMEEQLADAVEDVHIVAGRWHEGSVPVAVVAHQRMREWTEQLAEHGFAAHRLLPEALLLPWREGEVSVLLERQRALLRWSEFAGAAFELEGLEPILKRLAKDRELRVWRSPGAPRMKSGATQQVENIDQALAWLVRPLFKTVKRGTRGALAQPDAGKADSESGDGLQTSALSLDLMRPPYAHQGDSAGLRRLLRLAAMLAGVWLAAQFAFAALDYWRLKSDADSLYQAQFDLFLTTFPERTRVSRPLEEMRQELEAMRVLRGMGAQSGPLALLGGSGQSLQASGQVTLESFSYSDGVLEFSLRSPDMAQLEALRQRIERSSDYRAQLTSNSMTASGISGRLQVTRNSGNPTGNPG